MDHLQAAPMKSNQGPLTLAAGFCALIIAMGVGRFVYTSLLPGMMQAYGFDESVAGAMAAWNYAGYLTGALAARWAGRGSQRYLLFIFSLVLSLVTTAGMGLIHGEAAWHAIRFFSGLASGGIFVLASSIVLDALAALKRPELAGFLYSGVGTGIALGGIGAPICASAFGIDGAWIAMGLVCVPLAIFAVYRLHPGRTPALPAMPAALAASAGGKSDSAYTRLVAAYFLEGFGYIIGTTFLVALVRSATGSNVLADASWVTTGFAAALSAPLWPLAASRAGKLPMLILAFLLQSAGVLLPVLSASAGAAVCGGLLLGGTFMGITVLSLQHGVALSAKPSTHTIATMTVVYGIGQIIGPFVAGVTGRGGAGFSVSFVISSLCLFAAAGVLALEYLHKKQ